MGGPPLMGPPKIKLSNHTCYTHEIFRVGKYEEKIKFDKIWVYQNWEYPSNRAVKIPTF